MSERWHTYAIILFLICTTWPRKYQYGTEQNLSEAYLHAVKAVLNTPFGATVLVIKTGWSEITSSY